MNSTTDFPASDDAACSGLVSDMMAILRAERVLYRLKGRGMSHLTTRQIKATFRTLKFQVQIRILNAGGMARELAAQDSDNTNQLNG